MDRDATTGQECGPSSHVGPEAHPFCFACSGANPLGLALRFTEAPDGSVGTTFLGHAALEGYPGTLHGGLVATLLDGAMTHCLFARASVP